MAATLASLAAAAASPARAATVTRLWAGFTAGQADSQSEAFVAVRADVTVPSAEGCFDSTNNQSIYVWVGLGGTDGADNLVQQGVECNDETPRSRNPAEGTNLPDKPQFHPFYEFSQVRYPRRLCGSAASLSAGTTLYEQLNYQPRGGTAHFYMQNLTTGAVVASCSVTAPSSGWSFDGNTADYVVEAYTTQALSNRIVPFSTVSFSDAQLERSPAGDWAPFSSRPTTKWYDGQSPSDTCADPSPIGSDQQSFTVSYSGGDCGLP